MRESEATQPEQRQATQTTGQQESHFTKLVEEVMDKLCEHASDPGFDQNSRQAIAKVIKYLKWMKDETFTKNTKYLELLKTILKQGRPSIMVIQEIIQQMRLQFWGCRRGWGWFVRWFGWSAVFSMLQE
jgi:hypothetical protein